MASWLCQSLANSLNPLNRQKPFLCLGCLFALGVKVITEVQLKRIHKGIVSAFRCLLLIL